jgi:hypothetical protein
MSAQSRSVVAALVGCLMISGCARDVRVAMPMEPGDSTGSIKILLTQPASDLTVTVNGVLVAERKRTQQVHIKNVPIGYADVMVAAGAGPTRIDAQMRVSIDSDVTTTIPLAAPDKPFGSGVSTGILSVAAWLLARAIYLAFLE